MKYRFYIKTDTEKVYADDPKFEELYQLWLKSSKGTNNWVYGKESIPGEK